MIDDALFEGISNDLKTALVAGYSVILEGVGDARIASFLYRHMIPAITRSIFNEETMRSIYAMVNSKDTYSVQVYSSQATENAAGAPLTIKFTRSGGKPTFIAKHNVIEIPIMRALEHGIYKTEKLNVRGNPRVFTVEMPFPAFVRRMRQVWDGNPGYSYDSVSVKEAILRELSIWLAENRKPATVRKPVPEYPEESEGKTVDNSFHEWKDTNLKPLYRTERMDSGDAAQLSREGGWATPAVMHRHKEISEKIRRNWMMGRKRYDGLTPEEKKFNDDFHRLAKRYNQASFHATNRELQSRITALIPGLVKMQSEKGELPLQPTLNDMLDRVFDLPKDGPGIVGEERKFAKSCIMPGAFRSAARRCAGLIDAANRMFYSYDMPLGQKIECLAQYMERNASAGQISRQI